MQSDAVGTKIDTRPRTPPRVGIEPIPGRTGHYLLSSQLWLPHSPEVVFGYFTDVRNLETITPPWLGFRVISDPNAVLGPGSLIDYRLRLHGAPVRWRTEIAEWNPPHSFADQQLQGPYRRWYHAHTFEPQDGGTICTDRVEYTMACPRLANWLMVRRDLMRIFEFRHRVMQRLFHPEGA